MNEINYDTLIIKKLNRSLIHIGLLFFFIYSHIYSDFILFGMSLVTPWLLFAEFMSFVFRMCLVIREICTRCRTPTGTANGQQGLNLSCLANFTNLANLLIYSILFVAQSGNAPETPPWRGDEITSSPQGQIYYIFLSFNNFHNVPLLDILYLRFVNL